MGWGGPPAGSPMGGGSAVAQSTAAGLPFAGIPSELADKVEKLLDREPEHPEPTIEFSQVVTDRRPFTLRRFLSRHRPAMAVALALVVLETISLQAGPLLTQVGI